MKIARWMMLPVVLLLLSTGPAASQVQAYDYYAHRWPSGLLENVNKYHLEKARRLLSENSFPYAQSNIEFMLHRFPNHPQALLLAIDLSLRWPGHTTEAERYFERAVAAYPDHGQTWVLYGMYRHRLGATEQAVELYRKALSLDKDSPNAYYNLGLALVKLGRFEEARAAAVKAYDLGHPLPGLRDKLVQAGVWNAPDHEHSASEAR